MESRKGEASVSPAKEKELFENSPVTSAIIRLAFPTVVGQIILVIYNLADTFFIGLTGSDAMLTAVTVCMPAFMFLSAVSNLFGIGGTSVISRALGRHDRIRARLASSFAFWGCLAATAFYSLGSLLLLDPFIDLLGGTDPAVHGYAASYLTCTVVFGGLTTSMNMLLAHLVRAEGRSVQASVGIALGGFLNIILDPLFMFILFPAGSETLGAAVATALSNVIAALYFLILVLAVRRKNSVISLVPSKSLLADHIPADIFYAGLPACLMTLLENVSYAVLDKLMSLAGTQMQAGIGVAKKVNMLAHCIVRGIAQGALPLIGYSFSAGNFRRMRHTVLLAAAFAVSAACLCMGANLIFSEQLIGIFIRPGSESAAYGAAFLRILCIGSPFSACAYTIISFFQATGEGKKSFVLATLRKGIIDIPAMFCVSPFFPVYGIVWATPAADILCCAASLVLIALFLARHSEKSEESGISAAALSCAIENHSI